MAVDILAGRTVPGAPLELVTLYRAGLRNPTAAKPSWTDGHPQVEHMLAASGRWFTDDRAEAEWYIKHEYFDNGQLLHVTLPRARAEFLRVSNLPLKPGGKATPENPRAFPRREDIEFYLPKALAALARPVVEGEPAPLSTHEQLRPPLIAPPAPTLSPDSLSP